MITYQELVDHVVREGNAVDNDEAQRALEAVTGELVRYAAPRTRDHLREQLPAVLHDQVPAPRGEGEPHTSGSLGRDVAERVGCPPEKGTRLVGAVLAGIREGDPGLADELADHLPDWNGDTGGLTREVELPADRAAPLLNRAERLAHRIGHSFDHRTTDTGITFTVRTASVGAVTTSDIEMAERIDQAVAEVGSGG
ncbi:MULTISPECIES: DUF2267 domain-containing protein [unclassified Nocardiopsis]|uniref:DUF2267 domain-containing protein n=1 Tax=unclassified Nocardiopsis TaxID=2649073 RepID=UPI001359ABD2|nr:MULTISPECIES: DUF2267 domain-containing protein [unclassified Nocardiopsis]